MFIAALAFRIRHNPRPWIRLPSNSTIIVHECQHDLLPHLPYTSPPTQGSATLGCASHSTKYSWLFVKKRAFSRTGCIIIRSQAFA